MSGLHKSYSIYVNWKPLCLVNRSEFITVEKYGSLSQFPDFSQFSLSLITVWMKVDPMKEELLLAFPKGTWGHLLVWHCIGKRKMITSFKNYWVLALKWQISRDWKCHCGPQLTQELTEGKGSTELWFGFTSEWAQCVPEHPVVISPAPELIILGKDILSH